jgi:SsrA-binding protein
MASTKNKPKNIEIVNRKARFEYHFVDKIEAGIVLEGTEVKSVRLGQANLSDAYCVFEDGELYIHSLYIKEYKFANRFNHETRRKRKLLLKKSELKRLDRRVREKGYTIVPYRLYLNERNIVKIEIVLAQGKKVFDKRQNIKEREAKRDLNRLNKMKL